MVSTGEVEIFGFLSFSNWPDFDQNFLCLKLYLDTLEHKS